MIVVRPDILLDAVQVNAYSVNGQFSGWSIGLGGAIACRLYDKTLEIVTQSKKEYLFPTWREAGWNGEGEVWRLEFELKDVLKQLKVKNFHETMESLGAIWSYATTEWLRLTIPSETDSVRSRWPIHPLWGYLSSVDWESSGGPLCRQHVSTRAPQDRSMMRMTLATLTSFMAAKGIQDIEDGLLALRETLLEYSEQEAFERMQHMPDFIREKVSLKARLFNTTYNADPGLVEEERKKALNEAAEAYRKASDGE